MVRVEVQYPLQEQSGPVEVGPFLHLVFEQEDLTSRPRFHPTYGSELPLLQVVVLSHHLVQYLQNEVIVDPHLTYTMPIHQQLAEVTHSVDDT